jgi:DNA polymerase II small subunit
MKEILRRRHLSPIYGGNIVVPSKDDSLVIDEVPDILHMGHIHKNGYDDYHGTMLINSGTWQGRTGYQVKQGHVPSPCLLPIYETKSMKTSVIDFNTM